VAIDLTTGNSGMLKIGDKAKLDNLILRNT
jgi:hypothetical protein